MINCKLKTSKKDIGLTGIYLLYCGRYHSDSHDWESSPRGPNFQLSKIELVYSFTFPCLEIRWVSSIYKRRVMAGFIYCIPIIRRLVVVIVIRRTNILELVDPQLFL